MSVAPASRRMLRTASGWVSESHGLYARVRSGRTSWTAFQNRELAGSHKFGPHVVTARCPPGLTNYHSPLVAAVMSGRKKIPNTMITASKCPSRGHPHRRGGSLSSRVRVGAPFDRPTPRDSPPNRPRRHFPSGLQSPLPEWPKLRYRRTRPGPTRRRLSRGVRQSLDRIAPKNLRPGRQRNPLRRYRSSALSLWPRATEPPTLGRCRQGCRHRWSPTMTAGAPSLVWPHEGYDSGRSCNDWLRLGERRCRTFHDTLLFSGDDSLRRDRCRLCSPGRIVARPPRSQCVLPTKCRRRVDLVRGPVDCVADCRGCSRIRWTDLGWSFAQRADLEHDGRSSARLSLGAVPHLFGVAARRRGSAPRTSPVASQRLVELNATAIWLALLVVGALIEVLGRLRPTRVSSLGRALSMMAQRTSGRAILILLWVFVGFHLFARYTVPHG